MFNLQLFQLFLSKYCVKSLVLCLASLFYLLFCKILQVDDIGLDIITFVDKMKTNFKSSYRHFLVNI